MLIRNAKVRKPNSTTPCRKLQSSLKLMKWSHSSDFVFFNPFDHTSPNRQIVWSHNTADTRCKDLEHPVHVRVVVQRDGGAGPQQEHPHAEHLRLADVHVGDRGALELRRPGARFAFPGSDLQVRRPDRGH